MAAAASLPIGDFSRATHMSVKALRYYHRTGLLEPAGVDRFTGHRRYTTGQIPTAQHVPAGGPAGGVYATDLFTEERGEATVFIPCARTVRPVGRVSPVVVPAAELAVIVHPGPESEADRSYGVLAAHVARHALGVDGPIREYYLTTPEDTPDESAWRTEICWPIFRTATDSAGPDSAGPDSTDPDTGESA